MTIDVVRAKSLGDIPHGFLGRRGGVSTGAYASLNVGIGSDDDPANIAENRRRATEAVLPSAKLVGLYQVHSADAVTVIEPFDDAIRPHADALVTNRPGLAVKPGSMGKAFPAVDAAVVDLDSGKVLAEPGKGLCWE